MVRGRREAETVSMIDQLDAGYVIGVDMTSNRAYEVLGYAFLSRRPEPREV